MAIKAKSQADRRRTQITKDQHGRMWAGTIEIETGVFTGPLSPVDHTPPKLGTGVPLIAPMPYHRFDAMTPGAFVIDYDCWLADVEAAERGWEERLQQIAKGLYGDGAVEAMNSPSPRLLEMVGPKPIIPSVLVRACAAGNRYCLGFPTGLPEWAAEFFTPITVAKKGVEGLTVFPDADEPKAPVARRATAAA